MAVASCKRWQSQTRHCLYLSTCTLATVLFTGSLVVCEVAWHWDPILEIRSRLRRSCYSMLHGQNSGPDGKIDISFLIHRIPLPNLLRVQVSKPYTPATSLHCSTAANAPEGINIFSLALLSRLQPLSSCELPKCLDPRTVKDCVHTQTARTRQYLGRDLLHVQGQHCCGIHFRPGWIPCPLQHVLCQLEFGA